MNQTPRRPDPDTPREAYWLPAVLAADPFRRESAGSVLRALKNARQALEALLPEGIVPDDAQVALDDLDALIRRVQ